MERARSGSEWTAQSYEGRAFVSAHRTVDSRLSSCIDQLAEPLATATASQVATLSVYGEAAQLQVVRTRVGIDSGMGILVDASSP